MNKQQKEDLAEANAILDFRERTLGVKDWAIIAAVGFVSYVFFVGLAQVFGW